MGSELFRPKSPNSGEIADQTNIKSLESNKLNNGHSTNKDIVQKHKNWMSHFPKTRTKTDEKVQKSDPASSKPALSTAPGKENKETPALVLNLRRKFEVSDKAEKVPREKPAKPEKPEKLKSYVSSSQTI